MLYRSLLAATALPLLASAHFHLLYPSPRTTVDDSEATSPCGGITVSPNRTVVSSQEFPIALEMGHDRTVIQIDLALGNDPNEAAFNISLRRSFQQQGEGDFCLPQVFVPADLGIVSGMNGTLQVITNGEGGGGLYQCADITFSSVQVAVPSSCMNGTGVTASPLASQINANASTEDGQPQSGASASGSVSPSGSASATGSSASSTKSSEATLLMAGWCAFGGAVVAAIAAL